MASKPKTTATTTAARAKLLQRRPLDTGGRPAGLGKGGFVTEHGRTTTCYQRGCRRDRCRAAVTDPKRRARDGKREAVEMEATAKAEKAVKAKAGRAAETTS